MSEININFEMLPQAVGVLINEVRELKELVVRKTNDALPDKEVWLDLQELRAYLPNHPAQTTIYSWVAQKTIPYHKKGKKLIFLQKEIDNWLREENQSDTEKQVLQYLNSKRF